LNLVSLLLTIPVSNIWYCSFDPYKTGKIMDVEFTNAARFLSNANGLVYVKDQNLLYAANPIDTLVYVF